MSFTCGVIMNAMPDSSNKIIILYLHTLFCKQLCVVFFFCSCGFFFFRSLVAFIISFVLYINVCFFIPLCVNFFNSFQLILLCGRSVYWSNLIVCNEIFCLTYHVGEPESRCWNRKRDIQPYNDYIFAFDVLTLDVIWNEQITKKNAIHFTPTLSFPYVDDCYL